jgi:G3E family GTPase
MRLTKIDRHGKNCLYFTNTTHTQTHTHTIHHHHQHHHHHHHKHQTAQNTDYISRRTLYLMNLAAFTFIFFLFLHFFNFVEITKPNRLLIIIEYFLKCYNRIN